MKTIKELPPHQTDIMLTFKDRNSNLVKKRAIWFPIWNEIAVPPSWRMWNGSYLPHGFGGHHFDKNDSNIKGWEEIK